MDVFGEKVELLAGRITFGRFPFVFSAEAIAAARAAGIELAPPPDPGPRRAAEAPFASQADAAAAASAHAREHWQVLERVMLILVEEGGASLTMAASWCGGPDDALDGLSPAAWLQFGRDPERLYELARQDAARLRR